MRQGGWAISSRHPPYLIAQATFVKQTPDWNELYPGFEGVAETIFAQAEDQVSWWGVKSIAGGTQRRATCSLALFHRLHQPGMSQAAAELLMWTLHPEDELCRSSAHCGAACSHKRARSHWH